MTNHADTRGRLAAGLSSACAPDTALEQLDDAPTPPGWVMWRMGRSSTVLPELADDAPALVRLRYVARVVANCTGTCPLCEAVAGLTADPIRTPATWLLGAVTVGITHAEGCPAVFTDADRPYFPGLAAGRG